MTREALLELKFDWEPPVDSVASGELRATWARFEIWVDDECVTRVEDSATRSARRSIYVSLYPLAEWIAYNWWLLIADGRPGWQTSVGRQSIRGHNLRSIGDGFPWPNLAVVPERHEVHLSWLPGTVSQDTYPVRFISGGRARLSSDSLQRTLAEFVEMVINRLRESGISETPLQEEWNALRALDADEAEFCRAAAQLGLDPFSDAIAIANPLEEVFSDLEPTLRDEFLDAVKPSNLQEGLEWIDAATGQTASSMSEADGFDVAGLKSELGVRSSVSTSSMMLPWKIGYTDARRVREVLGIVPADPLPTDPAIRTLHLPVDDHGLVGLCIQNVAEQTSLVVARPMRKRARRFAVARALWSALALDRQRALLTRSHSPEQQAARAFAAEVLAPATGIQARLGGETIDTSDEAILEVADHYGVSELVVRHQIENQLLLV